MLLGLVLTMINFTWCRDREKLSVPTAVIRSVVFWSLYLYAGTELLSIPGWISRGNLLILWWVYALIQVLCILRYLHSHRACGMTFRMLRLQLTSVLHCRRKRLLGSAFGLLAFFFIVLAVRTVPYNYDSMVYHLTRIEHWSSSGSVAHYATDNWRALSSTPFAEFVGLHIYVLSGGKDSLVNLVQAISYLFICWGVYYIAKEIGCSRKGCVLSSILFAATPIAMVEANTTQNDEFAAMWLVFFLCEILEIRNHAELLKRRNGGICRCVVLAFTVGFGYLAKPTIFPAIGLFTIWLLADLLRRKMRAEQLAAWTFGTGAGAFVTILPEVGRNLVTYHSISYYGVGAMQMVGTTKLNYLIINFLKNLSMNLPAIYWPNIYWRFETAIYKLADLLRVSINDESIAESGGAYKISRAPDYGCDTAVSFVITVLIMLCTTWLVLRLAGRVVRRLAGKRSGKIAFPGYCVMAFLSFYVLLFLMRWEPYVNRYMLGYFAIGAPAAALQLESFCKRFCDYNWVRGLVFGGIVMLCGVEFLNVADNLRLNCQEVRDTGYFKNGKENQEAYEQVEERIREAGYTQIGLKLDSGSMEYPLLRMVREASAEYKAVNVDGDAARYEDEMYQPDCIVYVNAEEAPSVPYLCHGISYGSITKLSDACYLIEK